MKKLAGMLLAGAMLTAPLCAQNDRSKPAAGSLQLAVTYDGMRNGGTPSSWFEGGSVQLEGRFWRGLGMVANVSGHHAANMHGSGVGLDLVTAAFGPRYTLPIGGLWPGLGRTIDRKQRISLYGEALAGIANGFNGVFPASGASTDSANDFVCEIGGGVNRVLTPRISIRVLEVDWQRTTFPNNGGNVQNNLRLGAGVVWNLNRGH